MPHFSYSALTSQGELKEGIVDAISLQAARDAIKEMELNLEEIHESTLAEQTEANLPSAPLPTEPAVSEEFPAVPVPPLSDISTAKNEAKQKKTSDPRYFPLIDTLRLYAGWLLAWYCVVFALGSYQHFRALPFQIPYLEGLFLSPLVLSFTLAAFLFLLVTGFWKLTGKGIILGMFYSIVGVAAFVLYRMNVA